MAGRRNGDGTSTAGEVRAKLRSMILAGEFRPGQRLVEEDLCDLLGVGRTPVREGLLLLQGEGYLGRDRGWVVRDVDPSQIRAIFESRAAIEGAAARLAARRIAPAACDALARLVDAMEPGEALTRAELNRLNTEFHHRVVGAAENPFLAGFHERTGFYYWMLRVPVLFGEAEIRRGNEEHRRIVDALRARDEDTAERTAREHVEGTMAIVEPALRPAPAIAGPTHRRLAS